MAAVNKDRTLWLGKGRIILADGGAHDAGDTLMNPYFHPKTAEQFWFNFCQSSSRFFVEETFGRWKNRWRFLLRPCDTKHELTSRMIYASMALHNFLTRHKDAATFDEADDAKTWTDFYLAIPANAAPGPKWLHPVINRGIQRSRSWPGKPRPRLGLQCQSATSLTTCRPGASWCSHQCHWCQCGSASAKALRLAA